MASGLGRLDTTVTVVAPHQPGLALRDELDTIRIHRFRYAADRHETLAYRGNMHDQVLRNPLKAVVFASFLRSFFRAARARARIDRPDLIHAHWWLPGGIIGVAAARAVNRPLVVSVHGTDLRLLGRFGFLRPLARRVFTRAHRVTAASGFLKNRLVRLLNIPGEKIDVIPTPIQTVPPPRRPPPRRGQFPRRIITIARLSKQKRVADLVEAGRLLVDRGFGFTLLVIGDGDERPALERRIGELGLGDRVTLLGAKPHNEMYDYFRSSELFVLPSVEEGFGVVLVEAMACRVPVIGADSGGIPDIILDRTTGRLFAPENPAALARTILEAFERRAETRAFERAAFARYRSVFAADTLARRMRASYHLAIASKGGADENP